MFLLLLPVLMSSCVLQSEKPLGDKADLTVDDNLPGMWSSDQEGETNYLVVLKNDKGCYQFITFDKTFRSDFSSYTGYVTAVGAERYLNLQTMEMKKGKPSLSDNYIFANYSAKKKNILEIRFLNEDFFKDAITKGLLKGTTDTTDVTVKDTSENFANFVKTRQNEKSLFGKEVFLYKKMR